MSYLQEKSIEEVIRTKIQKYQKLAFETMENRPRYAVEVVPVMIGCLGGGVENAGKLVEKLIEGKRNVIRTVRIMQQTVFLGKTILRKVLSGIIQLE